jgi:uncharacterized protein
VAARAVSRLRRRQESAWVVAAESTIHGCGVYARQRIPDGMRIIEYTGERISLAEAERREQRRLWRQQRGGDDCVYVFVVSARTAIDGRQRANVARFINHSCSPNCRSEIVRGHIWIVAQRDIAAGEELTFDYGYTYKEGLQHPCRCGAPECVGFIVSAHQRWLLRRSANPGRTIKQRQ